MITNPKTQTITQHKLFLNMSNSIKEKDSIEYILDSKAEDNTSMEEMDELNEILDNPSYNEPPKKKRKIETIGSDLNFSHKDLFPELPKLMFAFGDDEAPNQDSCSLLSNILYHHLNQLAKDLTTGLMKPQIGLRSVFFELRDDPVKIDRANKAVTMRNDLKRLEKNGIDIKSFLE